MSEKKTKYREAEVRKKEKKKKNEATRRVITIAVILAAVVLVIFAASLFFTLQKYDGYSIKAELDLSVSDTDPQFVKFAKGYLKGGPDGFAYFNKKEIIWEATLEFSAPIYDVCGNYVAVSDTKSQDLYLYDTEGQVNTISLSHSVIGLEISKYGAVAAATVDKDANYIEIYNKEGESVLTIRTIFSSSGYLSDIALSDDGMKLAATYICVNEGSLKSKVLFYDFSVSDDTSEYMVGGFNQYEDIVLTDVFFMDNDVVCAVGDSGFSLYNFSSEPELIYEDLEFEWEIQTLLKSDDYVGFILNDESSKYNYVINVYGKSGNMVMDTGFDFIYNRASFANKGVLLYSSNECKVYDFNGNEKASLEVSENISGMLYSGSGANYILAGSSTIKFIRLN